MLNFFVCNVSCVWLFCCFVLLIAVFLILSLVVLFSVGGFCRWLFGFACDLVVVF